MNNTVPLAVPLQSDIISNKYTHIIITKQYSSYL